MSNRAVTGRGVFDADPHELQKECAVSASSALLIRLVKELCAAYLKERVIGSDIIRSPKEAIDYLAFTLSGERIEKFLAVFLNSRGEAIAVETLHEGTINQTAVYPRKAIERAFTNAAESSSSTTATGIPPLTRPAAHGDGGAPPRRGYYGARPSHNSRNRHWSAIESGRFAASALRDWETCGCERAGMG